MRLDDEGNLIAGGNMSYVFISHASPDKPRIKPVVEALLKEGLTIWIDNPAAAGFTANEIDQFYRIRAGGRWEDEIDQAKKEAACILVCWSKHAATDGVLSGTERLTWLDEAGYARTAGKLVACTIDNVSPAALPAAYSAQQTWCLDPDTPIDLWNAVMRMAVSDIKRKIDQHHSARWVGAKTAVSMYIEGLRSFCAKSTYTLSDTLSSDADQLFVDIEGGLTTIEALSAQAQGDTSREPPAVSLARELLADVINKNGAAVLCGGAGTGKSTLLRRFALLAWEAPDRVGLVTKRLPVIVRLRHLATAQGETFEQRIRQALSTAGDFTPGQTIPEDFLTSWPQATNVPLLFLLDGLDEVSANERSRLLTFLEQLRSRFANVPMVLSTRNSDLVRNTSFAAAERTDCIAVQQLSPATAVNIARALLSEAELNRFMQERDGGRSFAFDTALGVRMAAAIINRDQKLPDTRCELYERLIRQSFGDQADGAVRAPEILINDEGTLYVLGAVASMNLDSTIPSAANVETCVAEALQELRPELSTAVARGGAPEVISWIRRRGGVLTSLDPLTWFHETCREFLAARWIAHRFKPDDADMLDLTRRASSEPRLRSVMLFAFSIWSGSSLYRREADRSALAERVCASFSSPVVAPKNGSRVGAAPRPNRLRPKSAVLLRTDAPSTLFLAEMLTEIRPGPTPAIDSVFGRLSSMHRDFIGYFDEPKNLCAGDEDVVRCVRRWADHPPLMQALQPIADRYMTLFEQFDLPKSGVVRFLLIAGRSKAIEPILMSDVLRTDYDVVEAVRGAVAAEGPRGATAVALSRSLINGTHPALPLRRLPSGTRFIWGPTDEFRDKRTWLAPQDRDRTSFEYYYAAVSEAVATLHNAGLTDEVAAKIAADEISIDLYSTAVSQKKTRNAFAERCAGDASLSAPKRAFAIWLLIESGTLGELTPDQITPVLTAAEQDPAHTAWVASVKSALFEKLERFEEMHAACAQLTQIEPGNAAAWFDLGWSSYRLDWCEQALSAFERAYSLGHKPSQVHYFKARTLLHLERYAEAAAAFDAAAISGNDELRMWEGRLKAKFFASWYESIKPDVEFLRANGHHELPFVRHWQAIEHCLAGQYAEALEVFALLEPQPFWPGNAPFFRAVALIGTGAFDQASCLIDQTEHVSESWKMVLRAMLAVGQGFPLPGDIGAMRDRILSGSATAAVLQPAFWMCAALDDQDGAKRCVHAIAAPQNARILHVIKADGATITSTLTKPWCTEILANASGGLEYPKPPRLSGAEILKTKAGAKTPKKKHLYHGMVCRRSSIKTHDEEHALAKELMATHATAERAIVMIRLGKTKHVFILCNFKFSELDPFDLKHTGPLECYISIYGTHPLRDQILKPYEVRQVICNDRDFIAMMEKGVRTEKSIEYLYVDRLPDFGGQEVIYE
jgi:tetratricopeptide (TPR) repeat protein